MRTFFCVRQIDQPGCQFIEFFFVLGHFAAAVGIVVVRYGEPAFLLEIDKFSLHLEHLLDNFLSFGHPAISSFKYAIRASKPLRLSPCGV